MLKEAAYSIDHNKSKKEESFENVYKLTQLFLNDAYKLCTIVQYMIVNKNVDLWCGLNRVDPNQLASSKASQSGSTLYTWVKVQNIRNSNFKTCRMSTKMDNLKLKWLIMFR